MMDNKKENITLDWLTVMAYYTCKKLKSNTNHRHYTFRELDDFYNIVTYVANHSNTNVRLVEYDGIPQDIIDKYPEYFVPYISNFGCKGFSIKYEVTEAQLFEKFVAPNNLDVLDLLRRAYMQFDGFYFV